MDENTYSLIFCGLEIAITAVPFKQTGQLFHVTSVGHVVRGGIVTSIQIFVHFIFAYFICFIPQGGRLMPWCAR